MPLTQLQKNMKCISKISNNLYIFRNLTVEEEITAILSGDDSDTDPDYEDDNEISSSDCDDIESNPKLVKNPRSDIYSDACDEQVVIRPQFFEPERTASYKSNTALWRACL